MVSLCKHEVERIITHIKDPKWSTNEILIDTDLVRGVEHVVIRFENPSAAEKYGWFYMSGKMIRRHRTQPNGGIQVYVVPLSKREEFAPIQVCKHLNEVLFD